MGSSRSTWWFSWLFTPSIWWFGGVYTQLVEAIYWAGKIVPDFDPMPNALYRRMCIRCMDMTATLTARRYYVLWRSISIWGPNNSTKSAGDTLGRLPLHSHSTLQPLHSHSTLQPLHSHSLPSIFDVTCEFSQRRRRRPPPKKPP
jgi:hypothetical protein